MFSEYRVEANNPIPLIYQSGYLTIKDYNERFRNYLLEFPNDEVRYGFINFLVPFYTSMTNSDQVFISVNLCKSYVQAITMPSSPAYKPSLPISPIS